MSIKHDHDGQLENGTVKTQIDWQVMIDMIGFSILIPDDT